MNDRRAIAPTTIPAMVPPLRLEEPEPESVDTVVLPTSVELVPESTSPVEFVAAEFGTEVWQLIEPLMTSLVWKLLKTSQIVALELVVAMSTFPCTDSRELRSTLTRINSVRVLSKRTYELKIPFRIIVPSTESSKGKPERSASRLLLEIWKPPPTLVRSGNSSVCRSVLTKAKLPPMLCTQVALNVAIAQL